MVEPWGMRLRDGIRPVWALRFQDGPQDQLADGIYDRNRDRCLMGYRKKYWYRRHKTPNHRSGYSEYIISITPSTIMNSGQILLKIPFHFVLVSARPFVTAAPAPVSAKCKC
jgi:hypothetical protein